VSDAGTTHSLRAPLGTDALEEVHALVARLLDETEAAMVDRIRYEMAVIEIANNILEHSRRNDPPSDEPRFFDVVLTGDAGELTAEFRDDGRPAVIDFQSISMPDDDAEAGRGLALALATVDDISYQHRDGMNVWRIACRRSA
jgi:serine/threonine-protein kinase RsbW